MIKTIISAIFMVAVIFSAAKAEYVLGIEEYEGVQITMICVEDKVYADVTDVLVKTIWEVNGEYKHLNCKDYNKWRKQNEKK